MMLQLLIPEATLHNVVYTIPSLLLLYFCLNYFYNSLNAFPGPFWAHLTDIWRYVDVKGRRPELTHIALHRKYGDVVRLGPNTLSFADPKATKVIYGLNKGLTKVQYYYCFPQKKDRQRLTERIVRVLPRANDGFQRRATAVVVFYSG